MNIAFDEGFRPPAGVSEAEVAEAVRSALQNGRVFRDGNGLFTGFSETGCLTLWVVWSGENDIKIKKAYFHRLKVRPL